MNRNDIIRRYRNTPEVSVLIIGAGVNGIGTFRDLALQGVDVLLVDKGDFCSGASAASSHMVHGGIRYLENGEFRLVREAVQERNRLIENAPHYVKPLSTIIPIFKWFSGIFNAPLKFLGLLDKPSERGAVIIKLGLMLYDAFTRTQATVPGHQFRSRKASLRQFPQLNPKVLFTARYFDAAMLSPERICVEMVLDAEALNSSAHALNYVSLSSADGGFVQLEDLVYGEVFQVKPLVCINACGPWIDFTNARMGLKTRFIGGTKGSHLILDNPELRVAIGENEFFFENKDGRIVLIYPLLDKVMVGTSDLPIDNPEDARCTEDEIRYFFDMVPIVFPGINLDPGQIVYQFSGVRPLPFMDASTTGQISRDHRIEVVQPGNQLDFPVYNLIGGKWTSFRAFSHEATDLTLETLRLTRNVETTALAIGGGVGYPQNESARMEWINAEVQRTGVKPATLEKLFDRYGTRAGQIAEYTARQPDTRLPSLTGFSRREIEFITLNEKIVHLDDFFLRRSMLAKLGQLSLENIGEVAAIVGDILDWSEDRKDQEIKRFLVMLETYHGIYVNERRP